MILLLSSCSKTGALTTSCADDSAIQACFTPGQNCTAMLVDAINAAQENIYVQAYSFTSYPIAKALVRAQERGVDVAVIVDKSDFDPQYFSVVPYLQQHHIPLWVDNEVNIAHNKVMIFDQASVETGSFNFTQAAQKANAENMLIIHNPQLAEIYWHNWQKRQEASQVVPSRQNSN